MRNSPGGAVELQGRLFTSSSLAVRRECAGKVRGDYAAGKGDGEENPDGISARATSSSGRSSGSV